MEDLHVNCEIAEESSSTRQPERFHQGVSAGKSASCSSCGRDLNLPNLLHPAISKSYTKPQGFSRGHGICGECGGLGAGLLDGI
jgi:hypothetical protein